MIKDKIEKFKNIFKKKEGEGNKRTIENMVIFVVILIITIVAINYIWSGNSKNHKTNNEENKKLALTENLDKSNNLNISNNTNNSNSIEERLENILSKIKGVGNVKVLITYSQTSQIIPMYDEDSSSSTTEEKDSRRWYKNSK